MKNANYNCSFTVAQSTAEVYNAIQQVKDWWNDNISGETNNKGDIFTVHFGNDSYVTFCITENVPYKKISWLVTACYLPWLSNKEEWTGTEMVFEISSTTNGTLITATHVGLVPEVECYEQCKKGWDFFAGESLRKLITEGKGEPKMATAKA